MMAAAAAEMAAGTNTSAADRDDYQQVPVTWDTTEDAIAHALDDDPDLVGDVTKRLEAGLAFTPDRNLNIEEDEDSLNSDSPGRMRDSDTASNSSSLKEQEDSGERQGGDTNPPQNGNANKTVITIVKSSSSSSTSSRRSQRSLESSTDPQQPPSPSTSSSTSSTKGLQKNGTSGTSIINVKGNDTSTTAGSTDGSRKSLDKRKMSGISASGSDTGSGKGSGSSSKNPLNLLRRLTKSDKNSRKRDDFKSEFSEVVIDRLPQVFVAKYLGHRPVSGVCGLQHVRKPVDQMVREIKEKLGNNEKTELPLLYVVISPKGIDLREHKSNKVKDVAPLGVMPIDFISYGVQDIKYWRVFTCIVVHKMSSQSRTRDASCHAFLCDSAHNGRKMALALGAAFGVYSRRLKKEGKDNNFRVELRPPDQLADELEQDV